MAICDYCGTTYRGGAVKDGPYRYCTGRCSDRGKVLLGYLEKVPQAEINAIIEQSHDGPCDGCGGHRSVDVHQSYRIWSALIYSKWEMEEYVVCQNCASQRKWSDLMFCAVAGWWSPHGFLITPFSIVFNVLALVRRPNPTLPSERLRKRVRMNLARHLANNHIQTLIK
jgi:hypothetical protein